MTHSLHLKLSLCVNPKVWDAPLAQSKQDCNNNIDVQSGSSSPDSRFLFWVSFTGFIEHGTRTAAGTAALAGMYLLYKVL